MFPGINSRQAKAMMRRMGISQVEIPATEVIIKTEDKQILIKNPQVSKVNLMGQNTYQIVGEEEEKSLELEISHEDIAAVVEQTGVDEETARETIKKNNGDLAATILELKQK